MSDTELNLDEMYGDKSVRWYQIAARNQSIQAIKAGKKRILIVLPTGTGKTLTIACTLGCAELADVLGVVDRKIRVLFIAHNHRLLSQAERTFLEDSNVELILQSMMSDIPQDIIDAGWDITVLDEAHHEACSSMQYQLDTLVGEIPLIGLTATPDRADGMIIKFEEFVMPISREEAVDQGYLAETYLHTIVDGSERSKADIVMDILDEYAGQMNGTLVFVKTKKEVTTVNNHLIKLGYRSVGLLDQSRDELDAVLNEFSEGAIDFVVSCQKLSEGIDVKNCHTVIVGRNIGSYSLLNQIIGRAARPDCPCHIYEVVNPLAKDNLDTTCVVGTPASHKIIYHAKGKWNEEEFDYTHI